MMYATFSGHTIKIYEDNGYLYRTFNVPATIPQASVNGDKVSIVCANGYTYLYETCGIQLRQFRS